MEELCLSLAPTSTTHLDFIAAPRSMVPGRESDSRPHTSLGETTMRILYAVRATVIVLLLVAGAALTPAAYADSGSISFRVVKAGLVIGGSAGSGVLIFQGRQYPLGIGGVSYGFTFGASETRFHGTVSNIHRASDVSGVYAAGNVGAAVGRGAQAIVLTNQHGDR